MAHDRLPVELAYKSFDFIGTANEKLHLVFIDLYHPWKNGLAIVFVGIIETLEHPD